jgi:hypothetical protein
MRGFHLGATLGLIVAASGCLKPGQEGEVSFAAAREVSASIAVNMLTVGDFTRDGAPDLAVGNDEGDFAILLGRGNGSFVELGQAASNPLRTLIAADFNGDTNTDLALFTRTIDVYYGNGTGNFAQALSVDFDTVAAQPVDFNRDRAVDLAVVGGGSLTTQGLAAALFSNPSLPPTRRTVTVNLPTAVTVADFNGDGLFDIAVGDSSQSMRRVVILRANPGGTWTTGETYALGDGEIRALAVGDFAGDRGLDLAVTGAAGKVEILVGRGDATFTVGESYPSDPDGGSAIQILAVDINRGGLADLVVLSRGANGQGTLTILPRDPDIGFLAPEVLGRSEVGQANIASVAVFDANTDGRPDIALAGGSKIALFFNER